MLSTSKLLSSAGTSFHEANRSRLRRPRKQSPQDGTLGNGRQNGKLKDVAGTSTQAAADFDATSAADPNDANPNRFNISKQNRGPSAALFLLLCTLCLLAARQVLESLGLIEAQYKGGDSVTIAIESRRKRTAPRNDFHHQTSGMGNNENSTFALDPDPSKHVTYRGESVSVPSALLHLADITSTFKEGDVPYYFHIPRAGGGTIKAIASECFGLTIASEKGGLDKQQMGNELFLVADDKGSRYVNVDLSTPFGIERAKTMNLAAFRPLDLIVSPYLHAIAGLFDTDLSEGRVFTLLRNPIDRGASLYYRMLQDKKLQIELQRFGLDTLEKYARSELAESNWLCRYLSGKTDGELTIQDEAVAREVLRTKVLVGLLEKKQESFHRFVSFFGWGNALASQGDSGELCVERLLGWGWEGKITHPPVKVGSSEWEALRSHNIFDVRLYEFAQDLFDLQGNTIFHKLKQ